MTDSMYQIYKIQHKDSLLAYIGMTKNVAARFNRYKSHPHGFIGRALKSHGVERFEFCVIASAFSKEDAVALEIQLIAEHGTKYPGGYNLTDGGEGHNGQPMSDNTKAKLRVALVGRKVDPELMAKAHDAWRGSQHSEETKQRISASHKALMATNEKRRSFIGDWNRGRKKSAEEIARLRIAGKKTVLTDEQKEKHKAALKCLRWITNGSANSRIHFEVPVPEGWRYGRS